MNISPIMRDCVNVETNSIAGCVALALSKTPSVHNGKAQALATLIDREKPHVLGLQETKLQEEHVEESTDRFASILPDYTTYCALCVLG